MMANNVVPNPTINTATTDIVSPAKQSENTVANTMPANTASGIRANVIAQDDTATKTTTNRVAIPGTDATSTKPL